MPAPLSSSGDSAAPALRADDPRATGQGGLAASAFLAGSRRRLAWAGALCALLWLLVAWALA